MATKGNRYPTLIDVARRLDANGKVDKIVEVLAETNEVIQDAVFLECNDGTSHKTTVRSGYPDSTWRLLYQGVQPGKSTTLQIQDSTAEQQAYSQADKSLVDLSGDKNGFRFDESVATMEALNQNFAEALFYGNNQLDPAKFTGLGPRFNVLSADKTKAGYNVIDGGGQGATNTSIWIVGWGNRSVHCIYPKGSKAGIEHKDLGEQTHTNSDGSMYQVYRDNYLWRSGLSVRDWRFVVRIANIDVALLDGANEANLVKLMTKAYNRIRKWRNAAKWCIYANQSVITALDLQVQDRVKNQLTYQDYDGKTVLGFRGIPIRECEVILDTEARVVAG